MAVCADLANYGTTELPTAEFLTGGQVTGDPIKHREKPGEGLGPGRWSGLTSWLGGNFY